MKKNLFHYTQSGLDYVYLSGGVIHEKNEYGDFFTIKDIDNLHHLIGHEIITSPRPLRGQELRFLRSLIDCSQKTLGELMGVTRDTLAKHEADRNKQLPGPMDRMLRVIYVNRTGNNKALQEIMRLLDEIAEQEYQRDLKLTHRKDSWEKPKAA